MGYGLGYSFVQGCRLLFSGFDQRLDILLERKKSSRKALFRMLDY